MSEILTSNPMSTEDYLLICLAEEAAELAHAVAKSLRFGLDHQWPGRGVSNREAVRDELRDVVRLGERLGLSIEGLPDKGNKFSTMMELSRTLGRLQSETTPVLGPEPGSCEPHCVTCKCYRICEAEDCPDKGKFLGDVDCACQN